MEETRVCLDADGKEQGMDSVGLVERSQTYFGDFCFLCELGDRVIC